MRIAALVRSLRARGEDRHDADDRFLIAVDMEDRLDDLVQKVAVLGKFKRNFDDARPLARFRLCSGGRALQWTIALDTACGLIGIAIVITHRERRYPRHLRHQPLDIPGRRLHHDQ